MHVIAHGTRDAYSARRTLGLQPGCYIHAISVQIHAIGNDVADVDADAKPHGPIGGLIAIVFGNLLLHFDRAAHCPFDAIEHDQQRIACGLNDPPAMLVDRRVD